MRNRDGLKGGQLAHKPYWLFNWALGCQYGAFWMSIIRIQIWGSIAIESSEAVKKHWTVGTLHHSRYFETSYRPSLLSAIMHPIFPIRLTIYIALTPPQLNLRL